MNIRILVLTFLFSGSYDGWGQKLDSLKSLLSSESRSHRCRVLLDIGDYYIDVNDDLAFSYLNQAIKCSHGDSLIIVKGSRLKAFLFRRSNKMDSSLTLSHKILPIAERNKYEYEVNRLYNGLALAYTYESSYDRALSYYFKMLESFDHSKNKEEASVIFNNVGLVHFKLGDYKKALTYFERSLTFKMEVKDTFDLRTSLLNISTCHAYMSDYPAATKFVNMALKTCEGNCPKKALSRASFNLGLISYGLKRYRMAENHFKNSYKLTKEMGDVRFQYDNLFYLLQIYDETNDLKSAGHLLKDAENILSISSFYNSGVIQLCGQLIKVYDELGDIHKVAMYQNKYIQLKDSIFNEELTLNLMKVEAKFLEKENRAKIDEQAKVLALRNEIINRQRVLNIVAFAILILAVAFVILLVQKIREKRMINTLLEEKVRERTKELEANHIELLKSISERDLQMKRISADIKRSTATIKGLCKLSLQDETVVNAGQYIDRIEKASDSLQNGILRTLGSSNNGNSHSL